MARFLNYALSLFPRSTGPSFNQTNGYSVFHQRLKEWLLWYEGNLEKTKGQIKSGELKPEPPYQAESVLKVVEQEIKEVQEQIRVVEQREQFLHQQEQNLSASKGEQ